MAFDGSLVAVLEQQSAVWRGDQVMVGWLVVWFQDGNSNKVIWSFIVSYKTLLVDSPYMSCSFY
ncbi:hypothetical protein ES332_D09G182700v1 [Gossypium tomentosum]|uniref:Uncharacterized protein n=1 Tax=Gossypium tomentosum TaxID=34277 RepID=A0A5D2JJF2_GOSTO|nr:hypothetical protein ES332_D09G182700v1 [Gossypium tomentosum]